jgi:hypothetical protein
MRACPQSAGTQLPDTPFARKARATLLATEDARVVLSGMAVVTAAERSLAIQGVVQFQAIIDNQGEISDLEFERGPLVFYEVARESLLRWKYQPTRLNREPVEVATSIEVNFKLSR